MRLPDAVLLDRREPRVQREYFGLLAVLGEVAAQRIGRVVDLAFARQEHQHVASALAGQLVHGVDDGLHLVAVIDDCAVAAIVAFVGPGAERAVAHLHGERAAADLDDRGGAAIGLTEVFAEPLRVDGGRGDDELEVGPPGQQLRQVAEQEVDVQAAFVGFVDDQRVVAPQHAVALDLRQQDAIGHHLHQRLLAHRVGEPHGVADGGAQVGAQLFGDALGDGARGDTTRLGVADQPADPAAQIETQLRQLRALARPRLAGDDDDLMVADGGQQIVAAGSQRQCVRAGQRMTGAQQLDGGGAPFGGGGSERGVHAADVRDDCSAWHRDRPDRTVIGSTHTSVPA